MTDLSPLTALRRRSETNALRCLTTRGRPDRAVPTSNVIRGAQTAGRGAGASSDKPVDAELVSYRLEEAGSTLLALPALGYTTKLRSSSLDVVKSALEGYGWTEKQVRPAIPSAARITRMDEALSWVLLIPVEKYVLRRIVGARCLVSPVTERHLFTWRRLAAVLGADHKAIQRWHGEGIGLIVNALNGRAST